VNLRELQRRLYVLIPGETNIGPEKIRLIRVDSDSLSVYQLSENEEDRSPIDSYFFPVDLDNIKKGTLLCQYKRDELFKASTAQVSSSGPTDKSMKHMMLVTTILVGRLIQILILRHPDLNWKERADSSRIPEEEDYELLDIVH